MYEEETMTTKKKEYRVCCEELICEEGTFLTYGMARETDVIRDISTDRIFVEMITELVNRLQLDPQRAKALIEQLLP